MHSHIETISGQELVNELDQVTGRVADYVKGQERIIVEHGGQRFALVSMEDLEWLEEADSQLDAKMLANLQATADDPDRQQSVPFDTHAAR